MLIAGLHVLSYPRSAPGKPSQSALDDLQGSLQQWLEGQVVGKLSALIDILTKLQVEVTTMNDAMGHNHANKVMDYLEHLFERHEAQKDRTPCLAVYVLHDRPPSWWSCLLDTRLLRTVYLKPSTPKP